MSNINPYIHDFTVDLRNGVTMERAKKPLSQGDAFANKIVAHVLKDGQTVPLDGVAVSASVIRYDGATVPLTGTVEEGAACIVLNDECYAVPGDLLVSVVLAVGEVKQTILRLMLNVETSQTDIIADGGVIGSFSQLLAEIENMRSATAAAISAAERAEAAADKAEGIAPGGGGTGTVTSVNGVEPDEEGNVQITIPEVPAWAMAATKPTYTAKEVGADPAGTASSAVSTHNADEEAHPAIRQLIPTKTSQLTNDSGYLTEHQDISHLLPRTELGAAVDVALAEAQASGAFDGKDGYTPVAGVDYYTTADKAEFSEYIASELAKRGQLKPEFANDIDGCTDESKLYVLPDGYIYAFTKTTITTEGERVPNFTNLLDDPNAYTKPDLRYSQSSGTWKDNVGGTSYVIPIPKGNVTLRIKNYHWHNYQYVYAGTTNTAFPHSIGDTSAGSAFLTALSKKDELITLNFTNGSYDYATFVSKTGYVEIITANEEITYTTTPGGTETVESWTNTGHAFVPADYEDRIVELENGLEDAKSDIRALQDKNSNAASGNATTAFSVPAYCPTPQLPADGSEGSDFDYKTTTTQDAYDYMDALCSKYTQYITKQTMGKDASGTFDHNRYILSKAYWRAWQKENYPRMYAWINGSTVIYSVSVSPRVGDTMYTTPYIGTVYKAVTAVNSAAATASTRTVNGLVFTRHESGDVEPTIVFTKPPQYPGAGVNVYTLDSAYVTSISATGRGYFTGANGIKYLRYPFEDRKEDKTKPLSIFILANEHGHYGDDPIPSFAVMRMAKDLCKNTENPFLQWLKENCTITMIPVGNPWGYGRHVSGGSTLGYNNANNVNINRNYDTPGWETSNTDPQGGTKEDGAFGAYPGSEIETQHIMNTMRLCKPNVGISMHSPGFAPQYKDTPDNAYFIHQGNGYDVSRINRITEALYSNYGMGGSADVGATQDYMQCGKSPAYIQYVGAVGGLTETVTQENNTNNIYTSIAMEQAYTQMLLFLQTWCEEALQKAAE